MIGHKDKVVGLLKEKFFKRDVVEVAEDLVGKILCRQMPSGEIRRRMIVEVEAYDGPNDLACHGRFGLTKRTEILFGESGYWYVYLCYGIHWMLNVVTGDRGYPAAVLIRGVEDIEGPGRLTKYFGIDKGLNGLRNGKNAGLWIEEGKYQKAFSIERTPRIGIDYAGPVWAKKLYRFIAKVSSE